jgi:hypothetical protein
MGGVMNNTQYFFACLGIGVALALFKVVYSFFPVFLLIDAVVFIIAGGLAAARKPKKFWLWSLAIAAPSVLLNLLFLLRAGIENLQQGIGIGFVWSVPVILAASLVSGWVAGHLALRKDTARPEHP